MFVNSVSSYHLDKVWLPKIKFKLPCDLDLTKIDLKIDRVHLLPEMNICAKFGDTSSILFQVIIRTRFGLPKVKFKVTR